MIENSLKFAKSKLKSPETKPPLKPAATSLSLGDQFQIRKSTNFNKDDTSVSTRKLAEKYETWKFCTEITKPRHNIWQEQAILKNCEMHEPIRSSQAASGDAGQQQESWLARRGETENFGGQ